MRHPSGCYAKLLRFLQLSKFTFFNAKIWLQLLRVPYNTPTGGTAPAHTRYSDAPNLSDRSGQPAAQGKRGPGDCALGFAYAYPDTSASLRCWKRNTRLTYKLPIASGYAIAIPPICSLPRPFLAPLAAPTSTPCATPLPPIAD